MNLSSLREKYAAGGTPSETIASIFDSIRSGPPNPVWIALAPRETALARARALETQPGAQALPLYGVPFAVKDNIDVEGMPTTAGCPAYAYAPSTSASVVRNLLAAGAILIGKTNMDQFATGLVGTRSPYGACSSVFGENYISGGSSSGSAVAVARGWVAFSLGTDTAGSGRVPAAFNNLIGLKPTRGLLSTSGVVPACRTLDCLSIFANNSSDAQLVFDAAAGFDPQDPYSREPGPGAGAAPWLGAAFRFGVPAAHQLEFFGDAEAASLYAQAVEKLQDIGGQKVEIDFSIFRSAADLLYAGPWLAERTAAIGDFPEAHGDEMDPVVRQIIAGGARYSAVEAFKAQYRLEELRRATQAEWRRIDVLLLPTTGTTYTYAAVRADPIQLNTNLGFYTNFVNLLDLAAVAVPAGFRPNGLPFGVSLIGPAFTDRALLSLAATFHRSYLGTPSVASEQAAARGANLAGCVQVAVVGAHLSGQPLNGQLLERGARLQRATRTSPQYRLYALEGTSPPKPGLIRDDHYRGPGIEVEVWNMPEDRFGGFVAGVPRPLSIGDVELTDATLVKCFLCEPAGLAGAREITSYGGWRAFLTDDRGRGSNA
ncbi:MAG TPA: allophanate hydrolase [Bryobacteraceae bacterium]|jgi:allophanate hydrolase